MTKTYLLNLAVLGMACLTPNLSNAQPDQCIDDAMIVFDGSGSMAEMGFNGLDLPRIVEARAAMREVLPFVSPVRKLGLITYGSSNEDFCDNVHLKLAPARNAGPRILSEIEQLAPGGKTPLTEAVSFAADTLNYQNNSGVIVLVTDGKETCGGRTCSLAERLSERAADFTVHVIGFRVLDDYFKWKSQKVEDDEAPPAVARCLADMTGGKYFSANSTSELIEVLMKTLVCPLIGHHNSDRLKRSSVQNSRLS